MAATLIHIKSKTLLPKDPELEKLDPEEDPRKELVDRLLEYEKYKSAAAMLQEKRMVEEAIWSIRASRVQNDEEGPGLAVTLFDLVKTFEQILERAKSRPVFEITSEDVSVPDMILFLKRTLRDLPKGQSVPIVPLFEQQKSRRAMICLFLAILEMVKQQGIRLTQGELFGEIHVRRDANFDSILSDENAAARIEEEYKG